MLQCQRSTRAWLTAILFSVACSIPFAGRSVTALVHTHGQSNAPQMTSSDSAEPRANQDPPTNSTKPLQQRQPDQRHATWVDPARVAGHEKCLECHQNEIKAWLGSSHATGAYELLRTSENALEYAKQLHIRPADITKSSICVNCHGTPQLQRDQTVAILPSVSCEACHNGADGDNGWLNVHPVYGPAGTLREQESPGHFAFRRQRINDSGQLGSSKLYDLTKRCFQCHVNGNEALSIAGHDHGDGFEMVAKSLGEIRHNFVLDETENAKISTLWSDPFRHGKQRNVEGRVRVMFVLGQMVDLEMSFRHLADATGENEFSDASMGRIEDAIEVLAEDILEEAPIDQLKPLQRAGIQEIQNTVNIAQPLWDALDDEGFDSGTAKQYENAAEAIAKVARQFSQRSGNHLVFLDQLDLLPEGYFDGGYDPLNPGSAGTYHFR